MNKVSWTAPKFELPLPVKMSLEDIIGIIDNDMSNDEVIELICEIISRANKTVIEEAVKKFLEE